MLPVCMGEVGVAEGEGVEVGVEEIDEEGDEEGVEFPPELLGLGELVGELDARLLEGPMDSMM